MENTTNLAATVAWLSFGASFILGAISARTQFCTLGAVSDIVNMNDWSRMRMWVLAMAIAIIGAQALYAFDFIDLSKSFYVRPNVTWLSYLVGGLMFGIGMTLASGCGSRTLVRIGGGNVKSLVVFVFLGVSAYMMMKGLFAVWRVASIDKVAVDLAQSGVATQEFGAIFASMLGVSKKVAQISVASVVAGAMLLWVLMGSDFRKSFDGWLGGLGYGVAVIAGWWITAKIGYAENPETLEMIFFATNSRAAESLTFVAPIGYKIGRAHV